jgi:hypothetical protein
LRPSPRRPHRPDRVALPAQHHRGRVEQRRPHRDPADQADAATIAEAAASVGAITDVLRQSAYGAELEEAGLTAVAVTATREVAAGVFSASIRASRP